MSIFDPIEAKIEQIKADVRLAVEIAIYRETAKTVLSRLATLDVANSTEYLSAIQALGDK
jgi:hypothetical protein